MGELLIRCRRILAATLIGLFLVWLILFAMIRRPSIGQHGPSVASAELPRASADRLRSHVEYLADTLPHRDADRPAELDRASSYIATEFRRAGAHVELQPYPDPATFTNVVAQFGPTAGATIVVGAHYDSFGMFGPNPGADDNASGVAGLLELARLFGEQEPDVSLELVAFSTEEPPNFASPQMGSAVYARRLQSRKTTVRFMVNLEMIGYYSENQNWPNVLFSSLYPNSGDSIAVVGRSEETHLVQHFKRAFRTRGDLDAYGFIAPDWLPGVDNSDHRSFWDAGIPAVMVTDTGFIRNPNYHTPRDTPETLDYDRMAEVVEGIFLSLRAAAAS